MKKIILGLILNLSIVSTLWSMGAPPGYSSAPSVGIFSFLPFIFILVFIVGGIFLQIIIGKLIGIKVSETTGLILGILFIIILPFLVMGITIILFSNKKKDNTEKTEILNKFIGKNYKDILSVCL